MYKLIDAFVIAFWAGLAALLVYFGIFFIPVSVLAEAECLKRGYPKTYVTYNFKRYCANLAGAVTVEVTPQ